MPELRPNRPNSRICQCGECGVFFSSVHVFDKHRVGKYEPDGRRCLTADEMTAAGLINHNGLWRAVGRRPAPWLVRQETEA